MKRERVSEIIGNIDFKYVDEAGEYTGAAKKRFPKGWYKWAAVAACVALVLGVWLFKLFSGGELVRPRLDKTLGAEPFAKDAEVVFSVGDEAFGKTLGIYLKMNDKVEVLEKVKKEFGFEKAKGFKRNGYKLYTNEAGDTLKVYGTGAFEYKKRDYEYGASLSEKEMEAVAETALQRLGIPTQDLKRAGKDELKEYVGNEEIVLQTTLRYKSWIDGYDTIGVCSITVGVANGKVFSVGMLYSGREKVFDVISKTKDEVEASFADGLLDIKYDDESVGGSVVKRLEVTAAEVVYLDAFNDEDQPHVQPCYRLKGVATLDEGFETGFSAIVYAVPEEYYE